MCDSLWPHELQHTTLPCPSFIVSQSLLKLVSIESEMLSNHVILCCLFLLLPSAFLSIRVFSSDLALCIRWLNYWSFSISLSNECSELIPLGLIALISLLSRRLSRAFFSTTVKSILQCPAFLMVQLSHPSMTTRKTIALTRWTFVSKVMFLLFNMMFRFVTAFLPRSKDLNFMAAVTVCSDFGAQENKICHSYHFFPICLLWSDGTGGSDLSFLNVEF